MSQPLGSGWKVLLAYLLTDEAYAVTITHYNQGRRPVQKTLVLPGRRSDPVVNLAGQHALGIFIGAQLPPNWPLDFVLPLTFIALVVPALKDKAGVAAAVTAALVGLLTFGFPFKTGLLVAAFIGILTGLLVEGRPA